MPGGTDTPKRSLAPVEPHRRRHARRDGTVIKEI